MFFKIQQDTSQKDCAFVEISLDPSPETSPGSTVPLLPAAQTQHASPGNQGILGTWTKFSLNLPQTSLALESLRSGLEMGNLWEGLIPRPGSSLFKRR